MRIRVLVPALVAASAFMLVAPRPAAAVTVAPQVKFLEFNYCGTYDPCGNDGFYASDVADKIQSFKPQVVILSEICDVQAQWIRDDLANNTSGWTMAGKYMDVISNNSDCDPINHANTGYGNAILTRNAIQAGSASEKTLTSGLTQSIACVTTTVTSPSISMAVCNTHFVNTPHSVIAQQENTAKTFAFNYASGMPLLYGGDFNLEPGDGALDDVYHSSGGNFQEMDQVLDRNTFKSMVITDPDDPDYTKKIDYMFFKQAYAKNATPSAPMNVPTSDHHIYYGAIDICLTSDCGT